MIEHSPKSWQARKKSPPPPPTTTTLYLVVMQRSLMACSHAGNFEACRNVSLIIGLALCGRSSFRTARRDISGRHLSGQGLVAGGDESLSIQT